MATLIDTWFAAESNYPSNADIWWTFKNPSDIFDPATTASNVTLNAGPAPKGFFILRLFVKDRGGYSGLPIAQTVVTIRPRIGTWFAGRIWYAGIDNPGFSENIYFSQIVISNDQFGKCYQTNDPTSETLSTVLPTDGGFIKIPGCGSIYKLFPVQNGMLVFAANGIWFITGGSSVGFTAIDYSVKQISGVRSISSSSFVNVNGYPIFWNEEGIYEVVPAAQDQRNNEQLGLSVNPLTLGSILSFYKKIPLSSKKFARGSYNPITYVVKWVYKSEEAESISDRYQFDSVLNYNNAIKAFYPYSVDNTNSSINGVDYIENPGGVGTSESTFKYLSSQLVSGTVYNQTFSEERDNVNWQDWGSSTTPKDYESFFTTGYRLKGQGQRKFQPQYTYVYSEEPTTAYTWQGIWDFAATNLSNRYSGIQVVNNNKLQFFKGIRKLRTRGNGYVLQQRVGSVPGQPFSISGWSVLDTIGVA